jgi:predicted nucleic acid-binding Zn ribbon protein
LTSAGAGLLVKGSGFDLTDYGKDAHTKKAPEA